MGGLFDQLDLPAPTAAPSPRPKRRISASDFEKLKDPQGKPDKRGKYPYQKFRTELEELPKDMQDLFHQMINFHYKDRFLLLLRVLNTFNKMHIFDTEDYRQATGNWV